MIVFGCRGSRLALRQTEQVAERVKAKTGEDYRLEVIETSGVLAGDDRQLHPVRTVVDRIGDSLEMPKSINAGNIVIQAL